MGIGMPYGQEFNEDGFPEETMSEASYPSYSQVDDGIQYDTGTKGDVISVILLDGMIDGGTLDSKCFPPLEWVVTELIPEGTGIIAGGPKLGKSWFVGGLALAVAAGRKALGVVQAEQRPVLYMALEDTQRRLQDRYRKMLPEGVGIPTALDSMVTVQPGKAVETIRAYLELHEGEKPLLIVDTLAKVKPHKRASQESYLADYDFAARLKGEVDAFPGSSLLIVHHTRKMVSDDFVDSLSGTNGLSGAVDYVMQMARKRGSDEATLSITGRDVAERELSLTRNGFCWELSGGSLSASEKQDDDDKNLGDRSYAVIGFIRERWDNGHGSTTPAQIESKFDMSPGAGAQVLKRLVDGEHIDKLGRGKYVPLGEGE